MKFPAVASAPAIADSLHALYRARGEDWRRGHLGASIVGHECDRFLWLTFRWASDPKHSGQLLRLFERGNREESWLISDLRAAGMVVRDRDEAGQQFGASVGSFGCHVDGIVTRVPGAPEDREHVLETKSMNKKQFAKLVADGVRRSKPVHFAQMQTGMHLLGKDFALYVVACKDDDAIYVEVVAFDEKFAKKIVDRGVALTVEAIAPKKLDRDYPPCILTSKDGEQWPCQFHSLCHGEEIPERNCRTCESFLVATRTCSLHGRPRSSDEQRAGCGDYMLSPQIVNAVPMSVTMATRSVIYSFASGKTFAGGRR